MEFSFQKVFQVLFAKPNFAIPVAQNLAKNLLYERKGVEFLEDTFQKRIQELFKIEFAEGRAWTNGETFRSFLNQDIKFAQGRDKDGNIIDAKKVVTDAKSGSSYHAYGLAIDFAPPVGYTYDTVPDIWWFKMGQNAEKLGLRWGGEWNGLKGMTYEVWATPEHQKKDFRDRPHIEWHEGWTWKDIVGYFKQ